MKTQADLPSASNTESPSRAGFLARTIRDHSGRTRLKGEAFTLVRTVRNIDREMYLVRFAEGEATWLFPDEVSLSIGSTDAR